MFQGWCLSSFQMYPSSYLFPLLLHPSQCNPVIFLAQHNSPVLLCFISRLPSTCALPSSPVPLSLPPILRLTSFIHHSLAHLALFPTPSDELTLELRDDGREVGVRGMCQERVGGRDIWGQVHGEEYVKDLKRKDISKSAEENLKDVDEGCRLRRRFCTEVQTTRLILGQAWRQTNGKAGSSWLPWWRIEAVSCLKCYDGFI